MERNKFIAIVVILGMLFVAIAWPSYMNQRYELKQAEIKFHRDKAHQELLVQKIREERLLKEARIRELEMTGSFVTKEGIVYDQSLDKVN